MNKIATILSVVVVSSSVVCAEEKAEAIVQKAIKAHGGEAKVAKLRTMRIKAEGMATLARGQPDVLFIVEDVWQMPDRYKTSSSFHVGDQKVAQTQAIVGDKGWIQMNGQTQDMPKEAIAEMKEQKYGEDLDRLAFLKDRSIELSTIAPIEVGGRPAVGLLAKSKGHRDVKLYFDKASGLLVKREQRVLDSASGKEVRQEVLFSDYQEKEGVKHYRKIAAFRDGKKLIEAKVTEMTFFDKLDDKVFAKP